MHDETLADRYARYRRIAVDRPLPLALVDMDLLDRNIETILAPARHAGKPLRVATKSVRSIDLLRHIEARGGGAVRGVMAFAAREAATLVQRGFRDVLLAYPTARPEDARLLASANRGGATVAVVVDDVAHLDLLDRAGADLGATIPIVVDLDMSVGLAKGRVHLGVRRSPIRTAAGVVSLARAAAARPHLRFHGVMGYEAQIAGLPDAVPESRAKTAAYALVKKLSLPHVRALRREVADALLEAGLPCPLFNGGGTGSMHTSTTEGALTEVTAGSGFLDSHLFDHFADLPLVPASCFALQVSRRPATGFVTCHGGGLVASGAAGADRLPRPYLPEGLALLPQEGAGEVQTPLAVPESVGLVPGDPVFFRHAKAGELAEHFDRYLLVRGEEVVGEAETYRGGRVV